MPVSPRYVGCADADVVKTRLQLQRSSPGGSAPYHGIVNTLGRIARDEGYVGETYRRPTALYRGIGPLLLLEAPKRAIKFGYVVAAYAAPMTFGARRSGRCFQGAARTPRMRS